MDNPGRATSSATRRATGATERQTSALTTERSMKKKIQNRAAQRLYRQRMKARLECLQGEVELLRSGHQTAPALPSPQSPVHRSEFPLIDTTPSSIEPNHGEQTHLDAFLAKRPITPIDRTHICEPQGICQNAAPVAQMVPMSHEITLDGPQTSTSHESATSAALSCTYDVAGGSLDDICHTTFDYDTTNTLEIAEPPGDASDRHLQAQRASHQEIPTIHLSDKSTASFMGCGNDHLPPGPGLDFDFLQLDMDLTGDESAWNFMLEEPIVSAKDTCNFTAPGSSNSTPRSQQSHTQSQAMHFSSTEEKLRCIAEQAEHLGFADLDAAIVAYYNLLSSGAARSLMRGKIKKSTSSRRLPVLIATMRFAIKEWRDWESRGFPLE